MVTFMSVSTLGGPALMPTQLIEGPRVSLACYEPPEESRTAIWQPKHIWQTFTLSLVSFKGEVGLVSTTMPTIIGADTLSTKGRIVTAAIALSRSR